MKLELRFFANFRSVVGQKELQWEVDGESTTIGDVLHDLEAEYPDLEFFEADGELREFISVLKNGRDIQDHDGVATEVTAEDRISIFPPVAGG